MPCLEWISHKMLIISLLRTIVRNSIPLMHVAQQVLFYCYSITVVPIFPWLPPTLPTLVPQSIPTLLSMCPFIYVPSIDLPLFPTMVFPIPSTLVTVSLFFISKCLVLFHSFVLIIRFHSIYLSPPGLFCLA